MRRSVYLRRKFGAGYETLVRSLGDYVSCDTARLPDGKFGRALSPEESSEFFSKEGRPVWRGELTYRGAGVSDLAVDGEFFLVGCAGAKCCDLLFHGDETDCSTHQRRHAARV